MQITLDTLSMYERLKAANLDEKAAREISELFKENTDHLIEKQKEELATKNDLNMSLQSMKADIIKWVAGMLVAQAAIVATLVKLL